MGEPQAAQELRELPVDQIAPNLSQPRRYFDEATLDALAGSLRGRGVLQPVLVRSLEDGKYELIVGERRWRAAKIAGLARIPALVCPFDDGAALEAALIESMAREDLNPVEEARACVTLSQEFGLTHQQIGERVGRSASAVANLMRLLNLSAELVELIERGELSASHGKALLSVKDLKVHSQLARAAIKQEWTVRTLEDRARASNNDVSDLTEDGPAPREQEHDLEAVALNVVRVWGDALGVEVSVRGLGGRKLRLEVVFDSPKQGLALGGLIGEKIARGSKRR
jgi:ParB family transcriptional regulator, chromosome partitioning protein